MILGRPQDAMASRFREAVQFVLGFWAQLAAQRQQFCFNHGRLTLWRDGAAEATAAMRTSGWNSSDKMRRRHPHYDRARCPS